jgi:hypothetical protein
LIASHTIDHEPLLLAFAQNAVPNYRR